jgi:hypothetical protein
LSLLLVLLLCAEQFISSAYVTGDVEILVAFGRGKNSASKLKLLRFFEPIGMTLAHIKHHHKRNVASKYQPRRAFRSIYFARFSENSESYKNAMSLENQNFLKKCSFPKLL